MAQNDLWPDQVTQVRGFADQQLRKLDDPFDPANRRISLIVQYQEKKPSPGQGNAIDNAAEGKGAIESGDHTQGKKRKANPHPNPRNPPKVHTRNKA
jgi:chemotaxis protein MotB